LRTPCASRVPLVLRTPEERKEREAEKGKT
jgi:hypothetical protein